MRILIMASPVAPLGTGPTGGVTRHIATTVKAFAQLGYESTIIAPRGSVIEGPTLIEIDGMPQPTSASDEDEGYYLVPPSGVLAAMWHNARLVQNDFDLILNFAHDWLPYFLTNFFSTPLFHIVNMSDVNRATTAEIVRISRAHEDRVAVLTHAQAARLEGLTDPMVISFGLDLDDYSYVAAPKSGLVWAGRISPEKGVEEALAIAAALDEQLTVAGAIGNEAYWRDLQETYGDMIDYRGFMDQQALQALLGNAKALLQTQHWHEAFGIVTIEAMACGTPVIAYDRGSNAELIGSGTTGFVVSHGDQTAAVEAVKRLNELSRRSCRIHVDNHFSLQAYTKRLEQWLGDLSDQTTD